MPVDLATHGVASIVVDDNNVVSIGSRAICWAKRSLEIFDRLGIGDRMLEKGVTWKLGGVYRGDEEVYNFDLRWKTGTSSRPSSTCSNITSSSIWSNAVRTSDLIDLRFKNRVLSISRDEAGVAAEINTDGAYTLRGDYLLACDGANSRIRRQFGLDFEGRHFEERFLIAGVEMQADFPSERWFWFTPTFHPGQSALLHKQPDNIYRIDLQLGPDADPEEEKKPENVIPRIEKVVGGQPFKLTGSRLFLQLPPHRPFVQPGNLRRGLAHRLAIRRAWRQWRHA